MGRAKLQAGSEIDTLNSDEMRGLLDDHTRNWYQEMARGLLTADFPLWTQTVSGGDVAWPASGDPRMGPRPGMLWAVQRISAFGLGTGDTLQIYRGEAVPTNFVGQLSAAQPWFHIGGHGFLLRGEQYITIAGTGLTATGVITITGDAIECSELDLYKVLG